MGGEPQQPTLRYEALCPVLSIPLPSQLQASHAMLTPLRNCNGFKDHPCQPDLVGHRPGTPTLSSKYLQLS
ncbi:hypothetical protein LEMLEM_LOCUS19271, partial [Lemmus lemmus]